MFYAERILRKIEALNELLMAEPSVEKKSDYLDEIGRWHSILMGKESDKKSEILEKSSGKYFKHSTDVQVQRIRNVAARTYDEASSAVSSLICEHYGPEVFVSTPGAYQSELIHQTPFNAGSCDLLGKRESQEDTLVISKLKGADLAGLSKRELGYRLWTSLKEIDAEIVANSSLEEQGATASTTIIRGDDIITATIGGSVSFAILYDTLGAPFVYRLNHRLHSPDEPQELERLKQSGQVPVRVDEGGHVYSLTDDVKVQTEVRLLSGINMSRSVGDKTSRPYGATADADIDIHSLSELKAMAKANAGFTGEVSKIQIMVACDGFTNIADKGCKGKSTEEHKAKQESFLRYCLNYDSELKAVTLDESTLAERCAKLCLEAPHKKKNNPSESTKYLEEFRIDGMLTESADNISVAIQTVPLEQSLDDPFAVMLGIFDGHGGNAVSRILARSIPGKLTHQLQLSPEQYADQTLSVYNRSGDYERDNKRLLEANAEKLYSLVDKLHRKIQYIKVILLLSEPLPGDFKYQERMDECKELLKEIHRLRPYFSRVRGCGRKPPEFPDNFCSLILIYEPLTSKLNRLM